MYTQPLIFILTGRNVHITLWKRTGKEKRPFYIYAADQSPLLFAGLWDRWNNRGELLTSCAIITTPANDLVAELHDRMPAILLPEFHHAWLDPRTDRSELLRMLKPYPAAEMTKHPVSSAVNAPDNDSADLLARVETEVGQTFSLF